MNKRPEKDQVSLAGAAHAAAGRSAGGAKGGEKRKKRKRVPIGAIVLLSVVAVIAATAVGVMLYNKANAGPALSGRELVEYTYTPDDKLDEVSYYLLGVTGENSTDVMDMLAVLCLDRDGKAASVLQIPVSTWIGDDGSHAVKTIGEIWGKPKPIDWCETCRRRVKADEIDGGKHTCGTVVTTRTGSAYTELIGVINDQYGLPIDNYVVIPRAGLIQLIDALGGVDLKIEKKITVGGKDYAAGTQVLPGEAAVYYVTQYNYDGTPKRDLARLERQRALLAALQSRLSGYKTSELYNTDADKDDVLSGLMSGRNPVRYDTTTFGKSRLCGHASDDWSSGMRYTQPLAEWMHTLGTLSPENIKCMILPGVQTRVGATNVFAPVKEDLVKLLTECFDPAGLGIDESKVAIDEKAKGKNGDPKTITLDTVLVPQTAPTTTAEPTTTAAEGDEG